MKVCTVCKDNQTNDQFYKKLSNKDGLQNVCKTCGRAASKKYTRKNPVKNREYTKNRKAKFLARYEEYKKKLSCEKCGDTRHYVLEFHHRNQDEKSGTVARIKQNGNWKQLMEEISKCEVLCANCHREHHYLNKDTYSHS